MALDIVSESWGGKAETSNKFLDARVGRALLVAGLRKWWACVSALWCGRDVEFPPSELRFADGFGEREMDGFWVLLGFSSQALFPEEPRKSFLSFLLDP